MNPYTFCVRGVIHKQKSLEKALKTAWQRRPVFKFPMNPSKVAASTQPGIPSICVIPTPHRGQRHLHGSATLWEQCFGWQQPAGGDNQFFPLSPLSSPWHQQRKRDAGCRVTKLWSPSTQGLQPVGSEQGGHCYH